MNNRLKSLCKEENFKSAKYFSIFYDKTDLYQLHSLHLNQAAATCLRRHLCNVIGNLKNKMKGKKTKSKTTTALQ